MSELQNIINIDNNFQKSINLQLDIGNENKVGRYISTESSKIIEKEYLKAIDNRQAGRATIIVGPYGKGKSHLLLNLMTKLNKSEKPFLPVIISAGDNLANAFKIALSQALERVGIKEIVVDSYYEEAVRVILKWKNEYKETYDKFKKTIKVNEKTFIDNLKKCKVKTLNEFKSIYADLTSGNEFNPLIIEDTVSIYRQITAKLCNKYNYSGMFIVFDEFSKFIEGHQVAGFANDMKLLQDMCELANRSEEEQIHITFVAHKSIKEYGNRIDKSVINDFRGVEGRLREIRYVVSSRNNYEIISKVILKDEKKLNKYLMAHKDYAIYKNILEETYKLKIFDNIFDKETFNEILGTGCYPLTPLSVWLLSSISEKVAQNERSIFTFLSGNEGHSLTNVISENKYCEIFIGADAIYDYFESIFVAERDNQMIHNEWLRADYALHQTDDLYEKKVIKTIALLEICCQNVGISINDTIIRLALGMNCERINRAIESLKNKNIIVWRNRINSYNFKINIGIDLENEIKNIAYTKYENMDVCSIISKIMEEEYILPKKYNMEYTMTRFFTFEFMTEDVFMSLGNSGYLFESKFSDGKIIMIISNNIIPVSKINKKLKALSDKRVIVLCSDYAFDGYDYLKKYMAANYLLYNEEFIENNKALMQELELYIQDLVYEINEIIKYNFMPEYKRATILSLTDIDEDMYSEIGFNRLLSKICDEYYGEAPKINNEMINKNILSAPIRKARIKIIDEILQNEDLTKYDSGTSPEATIYRAVKNGINDTGTLHMQGIISEFIKKCDGNKLNFSVLFNELQGENIGARKGTIPIYIANEINVIKKTIVIYYYDREIPVNGNTLNNISENPVNYSLLVEKGSCEKEKFIKDIYELFGGDIEDYNKSGYDKMSMTVAQIQKWIRSLPQYTLVCKMQSKKINDFKKSLKRNEINPRDYLFEELPEIFNKNIDSMEFLYSELTNEIKSAKIKLDSHLDKEYKELEKITIQKFGGKTGEDLYRILVNWKECVKSKVKNSVVSQKLNQFVEWIDSINTYDSRVMISEISHILMGIYVENWNDNCREKYAAVIDEIISEVSELTDNTEDLSGKQKIIFTDSNGRTIEKYYNRPEDEGVGEYLINAVEATIDEFGDSLEINEKVSAMIKILEEMLR